MNSRRLTRSPRRQSRVGFGGTTRPSAFAVLRLTTRSKLVDCSAAKPIAPAAEAKVFRNGWCSRTTIPSGNSCTSDKRPVTLTNMRKVDGWQTPSLVSILAIDRRSSSKWTYATTFDAAFQNRIAARPRSSPKARGAKDDPLATTKDDPLPTTTAIGPAHRDNPKQGNRTAADPNNGAKRRAVSGQRLWSGLGGGPVLRAMSVRVCERLKAAHSRAAER
jgi:hypothetical protein